MIQRPSRAGAWVAVSTALLCSQALHAEMFRFFGSAGTEMQLTPANDASPLNPGNIAQIPYRTNVADASLYADAKLNEWKLHVKLRGDGSDRASDSLKLGEGYVQFAPTAWLDLTAGRVIEKWGTGYAWNPTAFISPKKNPIDPNDHLAAYQGLNMFRADLLARGTNVSLYTLGDRKYAARVYRLIAGTDVSLHLASDHDGMQQGVSLARVFGDALELHAEVARRRAVAGGQYTFHRNVNVVVELDHDGTGMTASEWKAFRSGIDRDLLTANLTYAPLRMGRSYGFVRVDIPSADGNLDAELITLTSLRDGSLLARLTLTRKLRTNLSAYVIDTELAGRNTSELAYIQIRRATSFGVRWFF